jgi:hypothetical protein
MRYFLQVLFFVCLFSANHAYSQGCSDAGFCTIGSIKPHESDSIQVKRQKLSLLLGNGVGDENVYVFTPGIQYDNNLSQHWAVQARLTANYANGNLGKAVGLGDVFLTGIYSPANNSIWNLSFLFGTKLPLNSGDIRTENKPLPMQYQSSLGTIDVIAGITITNNKWLFATAIQQPVSGTNRNTFLPEYWQTPEADKYPPTNDFNRKGDVLLRVAYTITTPDKSNFELLSHGPSILDQPPAPSIDCTTNTSMPPSGPEKSSVRSWASPRLPIVIYPPAFSGEIHRQSIFRIPIST